MHVKAGGPETRVSVGGRRCRGSAATVASGKHEEVLSECETQRASRSCCSECLANKQHETPPLTELWPRGNLVSSCCGPTCFLSSTCLYRYCSGCGHACDLKNSRLNYGAWSWICVVWSFLKLLNLVCSPFPSQELAGDTEPSPAWCCTMLQIIRWRCRVYGCRLPALRLVHGAVLSPSLSRLSRWSSECSLVTND